ncbi:MAG: ChbG/HpnK family deacetylase [Deltaproteobacteria bacterium]|nr:MAG: ChbG/HpnK family deacetylase [Deltaproteobacteria bacterium]
MLPPCLSGTACASVGAGMARQLIVNADDFGLTPGVSRGIAQAYDRGIVSSASLVANGLGFEAALRIARARPTLGVGLHLNLTEGRPVAGADRVPTLVDGDGSFLGYKTLTLRLLSGRVSKDELRREIGAQIERLERGGLRPTHLDGHRHVHLIPVLFDVVAEVAQAAGIAWVRCPAALGDRTRPSSVKAARALGLAGFARLQVARLERYGLKTADCFLGAMRGGGLEDLHEAASRLPELPHGLTEWMVHPGEIDSELLFLDDYVWQRQEEQRWLCSPEAAEAVEAAGVELVDFTGAPKYPAASAAS